jgi:hypothetical protein
MNGDASMANPADVIKGARDHFFMRGGIIPRQADTLLILTDRMNPNRASGGNRTGTKDKEEEKRSNWSNCERLSTYGILKVAFQMKSEFQTGFLFSFGLELKNTPGTLTSLHHAFQDCTIPFVTYAM